MLVRFLRSCRDACCSIEGLKEFYARNHPNAKSIILRRGIEEFCLIHRAKLGCEFSKSGRGSISAIFLKPELRAAAKEADRLKAKSQPSSSKAPVTTSARKSQRDQSTPSPSAARKTCSCCTGAPAASPSEPALSEPEGPAIDDDFWGPAVDIVF